MSTVAKSLLIYLSLSLVGLMKVKKRKRSIKLLRNFQQLHDFAPPYRIVIDSTFARQALNFKINLSEQIPKYIDDEVELCTTYCVQAELETLMQIRSISNDIYGVFNVIKRFKQINCMHKKSRTTACKCLTALLQSDKYILASNDDELREIARSLKKVPIMYIAHSCINFEKMNTDVSEEAKTSDSLTNYEKQNIEKLASIMCVKLDDEEKKKKKKKKGGPNPLSMKKKKKLENESPEAGVKKRSRKRNKAKLSWCYKQFLEMQKKNTEESSSV